jgi:hypothetical protein
MRSPRLPGLIAAAALALAALPAQGATYFAVQTGMSGGQSQIDENHSSSWTFTTGAGGWLFGGGYFTMKEGPATVADITLSVYRGTSDSDPLVATRTMDNDTFCASGTVANCQSFDEIPFLFAAPVAMLAGTSYFVKLTSPAADTANRQYFIKGQSSTLSFRDEQGNPAPTDYVTSVNNVTEEGTVPEPMSMSLLFTGLLGLAMARRASYPAS